jgi:hypothetical protein
LVPVTNPNTEKGLLEIASAIALHPQQKSHLVYPFNLIRFDPDNLFQNMPTETENSLRSQRQHLADLISTIEPPQIRQYFDPIVGICEDVAAETAKVCTGMDLIIIGWHKPVFSGNRLGGKAGEILRSVSIDVAVFIDSDRRNLNHILVPYGNDIHDELSLELGLRVLTNRNQARLEIMIMVESREPKIQHLLEIVPKSLGDRISISYPQTPDHISEVVAACSNFDLTIAGITLEGQKRQTLDIYGDEIALKCQSSILIVKKYESTSSLDDFLSKLT